MMKKYILLFSLVISFIAISYGQENNRTSINYEKEESLIIINTSFNKYYSETKPITINSKENVSLTTISAACSSNNKFKLLYQKFINNEWSGWVEMMPYSHSENNSTSRKLQGEHLREKVEKIKFKVDGINKLDCEIYINLIQKKDLSNKRQGSFFNERKSISSSCPQPDFVSKDAWCSSGNCENSDPTITSPITHIIVHHQGNPFPISPPYIDEINSIYNDHIGPLNNFPDIGYHWLIDPNGILYQGTEEGLRGSHFSCMNSNTIGICLLGNFENEEPSTQAMATLKSLIAHESTKNNIRVDESSILNLPNIEFNNLSGHRDGNPYHNPGPSCTTTVCPGDNLYSKLSEIRNEIPTYSCYQNSFEDCPSDFYEVSGSFILPDNNSNNILELDNDYTHVKRIAYLCEENDIDRFEFEIHRTGVLTIMLTGLPDDFQIELYKNNQYINGSFNQGTNPEIIKYNVDSNSNDTYRIDIYGDGYSESNGNGVYNFEPYKLDINWQPNLSWWETWFADYVEAFTVTNVNLCENQEGQFAVSVPNECLGEVDYLWVPSTGLSCDDCPNPTVQLSNDTTYALYTLPSNEILTNNPAGCYSEQEVTVFLNPSPNANAGQDITIQSGESTQLNGTGGSTYSWSPTTGLNNPNIWNPIASPTETTTYTLSVTENGCTDNDRVIVTVNDGTITPPTNDDCSNAIELFSNTNCISETGTVANATTSVGANLCTGCSCTSPDDYDVYYRFTAIASSHTVTVSNYASNFDAVIELRTSCSSGSGNYISCFDPSGTPTSISQTWNNLTIGQTYYIRVFEWNYIGSPPSSTIFDICVTHYVTNSVGIDLISDITSVSDDNPDSEDTITINYNGSNIGDEATIFFPQVDFYISNNTTLSGSDDFLDSEYILQTLSANQIVSGDISVTLPNLSDGQYYLISSIDEIDVISESNENNNLDFYPIQIGDIVENGPNLDIDDVEVTPNTDLAPGQEINVEIDIDNDGNEDSDSFLALIIFDVNNNGNYEPSIDIVLGTKSFSGIDAGEDKTKDKDVYLPTNISSVGNYRIIVIADSENDIIETNEDDNDKSEDIVVSTTNPAGPDLVVNYLSVEVDDTNQIVSEQSLCLDEEYIFRFQLENIGSLQASTGGSRIWIRGFISQDDQLGGDDISIGIAQANTTLSVGSTLNRSEDFTFEGFAPDNYYLILWADSRQDVDEISEGNNFTAIPITISNCNNDPLADLDIQINSITPFDSALGDTVSTNITVTNNGLVEANNFTVHTLLSDDEIYHGNYSSDTYNDHRLDGGNESGIDLAAGASITFTIDAYTRNDSGIQPQISNTGIHYIFVEADYSNDINETTKANNIDYVPINLTSVDCYYNFDNEVTTIPYNTTLTNLLQVETEDNCSYIVDGIEDWILYPSDTMETGTEFITATLQQNPYPFPRIGHIEVNGEIFEFIQEARPCEFLDSSIAMSIDSETITNIDCMNQGSIELSMQNGFPPYTYSWSNGVETQNLNNISQEGTYSVTVSDISGCSITQDFTVLFQENFDGTVTNTGNQLIANQNDATYYQWLDCNDGNSPIDGATNQVYTPTAVGDYAVEFLYGNCLVYSTCINVSTLSEIENSFENNVRIYPNPVDDILNIDLGTIYSEIDITVFNVLGQKVKSYSFHDKGQLIINTSLLSSGMYFFKIKVDNYQSKKFKIIKE